MNQLFIAVLSVAATYLSLHRNHLLRRFACIPGMAVQPFWFYATWRAEQWGMFALCFVYSYIWVSNAMRTWAARANIRATY